MVSVGRSWYYHDHGKTMITVWFQCDHTMVSMFDQPGKPIKHAFKSMEKRKDDQQRSHYPECPK